jgi:hypothetical protein
MRNQRDKNDYIGDDKYAGDFGSQPRKSSPSKKIRHHYYDDEEGHRHQTRRDPAKNLVRMQLRRIEQLF